MILLILLFLSVSPEPNLERAEWLFLNRHIGIGNAESALALTELASGRDPMDEKAIALRARIYCQLGEEATGNSARRTLLTSSRAVADTLRRMNEANPAGHLWWASAHGRRVEMQGRLQAAIAVRSIRHALERAVTLDPDGALAHYALGRLLAELPRLLGGDSEQAEQQFRAALRLDRNLTIARLELARILDRHGRRAEATVQLDSLLGTQTPSHPAEYRYHDCLAARRLLEQWDIR